MPFKHGNAQFSQKTKDRIAAEIAEVDDRENKTEPKPIKPHQWEKITEIMRIGGTLEDAAAYARISRRRLQRNIDAEAHLARDVREMMADCKRHHMRKIYDGERGWQSSAWWLERMYRREYALNLHEATDEEKAIQVRKIVRRQGPPPGELRIAS